MTDPVGAVRAELDRLEKLARKATPGPWRYDGNPSAVVFSSIDSKSLASAWNFPGFRQNAANAAHIAANSPVVVLRRIAADRARIERHGHRFRPALAEYFGNCDRCEFCAELYPCPDLLDTARALLGDDLTSWGGAGVSDRNGVCPCMYPHSPPFFHDGHCCLAGDDPDIATCHRDEINRLYGRGEQPSDLADERETSEP